MAAGPKKDAGGTNYPPSGKGGPKATDMLSGPKNVSTDKPGSVDTYIGLGSPLAAKGQGPVAAKKGKTDDHGKCYKY